jgi:hypothetical protein
MTQEKKDPSVMRALGLTLGDLWSVLRTGKAKGIVKKRVVRKDVEESERQTPQGSVTVRRTVIEEVELRPPPREG